MPHIEKTVFISYRRTNAPWALAIYQNLTSHESQWQDWHCPARLQ